MKSKLKDIIKKNTNLTVKKMFYNKTLKKLATADCFD